MTIPHYINEDRSEMRGIKPGWYAMDDAGKLSSGPFCSHEECLSRGPQQISDIVELRLNCSETTLYRHPIGVEGGASGGPTRNRPLKD